MIEYLRMSLKLTIFIFMKNVNKNPFYLFLKTLPIESPNFHNIPLEKYTPKKISILIKTLTEFSKFFKLQIMNYSL